MSSVFHNFDLIAGILNPAHLQALQKEFLQRVVLTVEANVKAVTPVRTGHLRRSISGRVYTPTEGLIGTNVVYAPIVHRRKPYLEIGLHNSEGQISGFLAELGGKWLEQ